MQRLKENRFVRSVLFSNGVIDLFAALALFFPVLKLPLPGYSSYTNILAFISGGWGIAVLTFGIGRIYASYKPEFFWMMVILGLTEAILLAFYSLFNVFFLEISFLQAMLPLVIGIIYGLLYLLALLNLLRTDKLS